MDDTRIIELFWQRDETAIQEADQKYNRYLTMISYRILSDYEDTEECVSDTYLRAWNAMPPQKPNLLKAFLGAIARNLSLDCYRRRSSQKRRADEFAILLSELEDCIPDRQSPELIVEEQETAKQISNFLRSQPEQKQIIFIQRYWYCASIKTIAQHCQCSESKVKSSLFGTRKKLKRYLEKEGVVL